MIVILGEMAVLSERIVLVLRLNMSYEYGISFLLSDVGHLKGSIMVSMSANIERSFIVFLNA